MSDSELADLQDLSRTLGVRDAIDVIALRRSFGFYADKPTPAPEPTHCATCGQRLRKKRRPDFHRFKVVK